MPSERPPGETSMSCSWKTRTLEPIAVCIISPAEKCPAVGVPISALPTINLRPLTARVQVYETEPHMIEDPTISLRHDRKPHKQTHDAQALSNNTICGCWHNGARVELVRQRRDRLWPCRHHPWHGM
jgi:hypothetical protein